MAKKFKIDLMQGDCLEMMKEISDSSIDLVLADPPYGRTPCTWDSIIPLEPMWDHLKRIIKPNGVIAMTASQPFTTTLISSNPKMFKYCWVWVKNKKTGFLNAKKQPLRQTEDVVIFYSKPPTYNPQKTTGHKPVNSYTKHTSDGETMGKTKCGISGGGQTDRYPTNLIRVAVVNNDNSGGDKMHSSQKPVALMEYLIKTYTNDGDLVVDFAMGSGTTGLACVNLNRNFIGIELDKRYFNIAENRINQDVLK